MVTCAITTSVLGCMVTSYLFFRYSWHPDWNWLQESGIWALFLLLGCIPLFVSYNLEQYLGKFYGFYRYGLYFIFIGCIILFTLTLAADLILWLLAHTPAAAAVQPLKPHIKTFCLLLAAGFAVYALYAGTRIPQTQRVNIVSEKITVPQKIALLSDLHIHRVISPEKIRGIVDQTNALAPDIILLDGDIIDDDVEKVKDISALLKGLKAPGGIYFVTGNHEFYAGYRETVAELKKLGFRFLENAGVSLGELYIAGIPDLFSGESFGKCPDTEKAFAAARKRQFRLLMSHTPADFGTDNIFDLEVSGHTHGGQIFPFHILTKLHNKYLAGLYPMDNGAQIYVTRGAGQWGPQMRFLAPAEITLVTLTPSKEHHS